LLSGRKDKTDITTEEVASRKGLGEGCFEEAEEKQADNSQPEGRATLSEEKKKKKPKKSLVEIEKGDGLNGVHNG